MECGEEEEGEAGNWANWGINKDEGGGQAKSQQKLQGGRMKLENISSSGLCAHCGAQRTQIMFGI